MGLQLRIKKLADAVGICTTLISCVFYVGTWEIICFNFTPDFMDQHGAHVVGVSAEAVQAKTVEMDKFKVQYKNLFFNAAMTFIEPFPVGLVVTLISAAILRRKPRLQPAQSPLRHLEPF